MAVEEENSCLDLEDIAAYLDGLLAPADRQRVIRHLANCPVCFEVYAGAARFQLDEQAGLDDEGAPPESAKPLPFERPPQRIAAPPATRPGRLRRRVRWIAAAAAAVLVAALGWELERWTSDPERAFSSASLVADLARGMAPAVAVPDAVRTMRGPGEARELMLDESAFRLGVGQLDLGLALRHGNSHEADESLLHLANLFHDVQEVPKLTSDAYLEIGTAVKRGAKPASLAGRARELEEHGDFGQVDSTSPYAALGRWSEACRVASPPVLAALLGSHATARLLQEILDEDAAYQTPAAAGTAPAPLTSADDSSLALSPYDPEKDTFEEVHQTLLTLQRNIAAKRFDQAAVGCRNLLDRLGRN